MGDFNNYKLFKNVGIRSSDNKLIVMNVNKSNNVSFYSSDGGTNNIDVMSINSIINKSQNEDLNLSSLTGNKINPVITINNNHGDCRIMTNLNVAGNVNINNNLIIPTHSETSTLLANVQGSIYFNTSENMYEGYVNNTEGWQPLGGFSKTKDATIHKNLNVIQNINCTDKITSNINFVNHNLIIPTHSETSTLLSNVQGSIYFNTSENMYEGYVGDGVGQGWQPLGGFSKTKDATIHKNLNVLGNLNITGNMNQINSTQITVNDKNIILASNNNADNYIEDGGLILQGATQKSILWKSANGWKSSEKITAPHLDTVANQLLIGNTQVGLNLNFSGNNLHINGNVPKAGQVLVGSGSEIKWANTDNSLINNQLIKVETGFNSTSMLNLNSGSPNYTKTYIAHNGYTLNQETKKIIIIVNFALYINFHSNLTSKVKLELFINNSTEPQHTIILQEMFSNRSYEYTKYFSVSKNAFTGASQIDLKFTDMNNSGNIKLFTNNNSTHKPPIITLQEIGDRTVKAILDETRGSKTDQIAKVLVNTNANVTSTVLLNTPHTYNLHSSYTPSVNDTGTIIIIVNFTLYINFNSNSNLTSEVKLELLLNNPNNNSIPQERTIILQEMFSNKSYEYTKYFSISKSDFGTDKSIQLKFTDINNSGNITLFTNDGTNVKKPKVTIQEIGSTTGWGTTIENIAIGQTTSADASFNKVIIKNNLDVSGNLNINKIAINGSFGNSGEVLKSTGQGLEWGTGGTEIDLSSSTGIGTRLISGKQLILGNSPISLNLNFSGNNLHINGNVPTAGQVLMSNGSEVKWANTDNSLINNQLIKVVTETCDGNQTTFEKIEQNSDIITLTGNTSQEKQITLSPYIVNNNTKKVIIIFNFSVYDTNLVSEIQIELLLGTETSASDNRKLIIKNMTGNQKNDYTKYFSLDSSDFSGGKNIKFKFTGLTNTGNIKIFTNDGTNFVSPVITLQEIGDRTVKAILDETRGSKTDQIAKVLVNTNANVSSPILLNTSQATNYVYPYELHGNYTPSVSDTGTIIIIVNFALYISFHSNLTSEVKLELLLNNPNNNSIPQKRTITLKEMASNRSYEYTKYFSISKSDFGTGNKIELRFTDMNNSGNIKLFTNDNSTIKQPTVTIQEIGSTTGWGSAIDDIPIGQTTSADGSFNKMVVKHNLDVSGNVNIIGNGIINTSLGIGTTSLNNGFTSSNVHTNSILDINGQTTIRGHILPSQNAQFDLGNAEYKIRHLFLSDNSLWIGDEHKIDISSGKMKFKKRDKTKAPKKLNNEAITVEDVKSLLSEERKTAIGNDISKVKLSEWYNYADSIGIGTSIFTSNDTVWAEDIEVGSSTWVKNGNDIIYTDGKIGIGTNNPATDFEVKGNFNLTTIQPGVATGISITNRNKKRWGIRIPGVVYNDDNSVANVNNGIAVGSLENNPTGTSRVRAAYIPDSNMARYLGMTQAALDTAKAGGTAIDVDVYNADGVFIRQDNIRMWTTNETAAVNSGTNYFPILKNSDESANWLPDEYIRGRNINPIGSYVGIGTTNSDYELSVHGQIYILGTSHPKAGFGGEDAWPLKINLDGNSEMNSVRDPTKTTDWVALGAKGMGGLGQHDHRRTAPSATGAAIGTGLDKLYFVTNKRDDTGYVQLWSGGTNTNLLSFTGQHRNVANNIDIYNNIDNYIGYIVYSTGNYKTYNYDEEILKTDKNAITINDSLPEIALSNKKQQKSVFGVLSNKEEEERNLSIGNFHTPYPNINDDKRLYVNSMGEGAIWIVNTNGNLENGDYIQSSDVIGMGEKQDSEFLANYTVAKITCDCNFELNTDNYECIEFIDPTSGNTYKKAFVGCTYHCG